MTEGETMRDLLKAYWAGKDVVCPKHPGVKMTGSFVQTTFADHVFLTCMRGKEEDRGGAEVVVGYRLTEVVGCRLSDAPLRHESRLSAASDNRQLTTDNR